jgi:DNA-binding transcriptional LysR family regulator
MDRLTELSTFIAVVERGSFTAAARTLGRSPPTITRTIAELEGRLGVRLFDRSSRRCTVTEAGRSLAEDARQIIADYGQALSSASGHALAPRGRLRITAPYSFGQKHIAPLIIDFIDTHAGISCELDLSDRPADLLEDAFDLAVRIGPITDAGLVVRRVGFVKRVIVASPSYLKLRGSPVAPCDIAAHDIVQHGSYVDRPWRLRGASGTPVTIPVQPRFSVNQADAALAAARAGRGLVTALSYQVHDDLQTGSLVTVLERFEPDPIPVRLVWPEGRDRLLRVRMLIDHLAGQLAKIPVLS